MLMFGFRLAVASLTICRTFKQIKIIESTASGIKMSMRLSCLVRSVCQMVCVCVCVLLLKIHHIPIYLRVRKRIYHELCYRMIKNKETVSVFAYIYRCLRVCVCVPFYVIAFSFISYFSFVRRLSRRHISYSLQWACT